MDSYKIVITFFKQKRINNYIIYAYITFYICTFVVILFGNIISIYMYILSICQAQLEKRLTY